MRCCDERRDRPRSSPGRWAGPSATAARRAASRSASAHMVAHRRGGACAAIDPPEKDGLPPLHRARAARHRAWSSRRGTIPILTAINTIVPALLAGNAVILKHAARRCSSASASPRRSGARACPRACSRISCSSMTQTEKLIGSGRIDHINFTGSVEGGRAHRARRRRHLRLARPRARRQGPGLCARRRQARPCRRESGRRRVLQFRPVLLRHRAHLCRRDCLRRFRRGLRRLTRKYVRRQSARAGDHARPDGARRLRRHRPRAGRGGQAQGRDAADQYEASRATTRARPTSRPKSWSTSITRWR